MELALRKMSISFITEDDNGKTHLGLASNIVDCIILSLTIIGAGAILVNMAWREWKSGKGATVRSRLVTFLVFSDFMLGVVGIIPVAATLSGNPPGTGTRFCNASGFLIATVLWTQHLSTLVLCLSTYFILIYPLSAMTRALEQHWLISLPGVWGLSFVFAGIGWGVNGFSFAGGICYWKADLFSEIYQFAPRALVFVIITVAYVRLFVFLRRPDKLISSGKSSLTTNSGDKRGSRNGVRGSISALTGKVENFMNRRTSSVDVGVLASTRRKSSQAGGISATNGIDAPNVAILGTNYHSGSTDELSSAKSSTNGVDDIPLKETQTTEHSAAPLQPWERLELPSFSGGDPLRSLDAPPANQPSPSSAPPKGTWAWGGGPIHSRSGSSSTPFNFSRSSTPVSKAAPIPLAPPPAHSVLKRQILEAGPKDLLHAGPLEAVLHQDEYERAMAINPGRRQSHVSFMDDEEVQEKLKARQKERDKERALERNIELGVTSSQPPSRSSSPVDHARAPNMVAGRSMTTLGSNDDELTTPSFTMLPEPPVSIYHRSFSSSTSADSGISPGYSFGGAPPQTQNKDTNLPAFMSAATSHDQHNSTHNLHTSPFPISDHNDSPSPRSSFSASSRRQYDKNQNLANLNDSSSSLDDFTFERALSTFAPPTMGQDPWGPDANRPVTAATNSASGGGGGGSRDQTSSLDNAESMASYMNRKAALLMLAFPLAYVVLFSVSLIRLIYEFVRSNPLPALSAVSRWTIFSQGLVDALIYGVIEWKVKRSVRRKTRQGHFSSRGSASNQGAPTTSAARQNSSSG